MQASVLEGSQFIPFTSPGSSTTLQNQGDKIQANRDFLEELKYLFLRVRNPRKGAFEELVLKIFRCELNSTEGVEYFHIANRHFGDFRNSLVNNVMDLIQIFYYRSIIGHLQKEEILAFVDESATAHVLSQWLNATNIDELKAQNSMRHLCKFIQQAFAINYSSRNIEKMKPLDKLTKDITVPSQNEKTLQAIYVYNLFTSKFICFISHLFHNIFL
ncbi:hypothetical protein F8M41_024913 [Gigaspora margarita]|uniref:Uncharacterized protein n=1 Tax=Gigaspora margarita TaxID=4874 RepID=A0A8H4ABF7_GIGMA|nr:hypothetical protein F8M41_024913 [Gigaspora margarita]